MEGISCANIVAIERLSLRGRVTVGHHEHPRFASYMRVLCATCALGSTERRNGGIAGPSKCLASCPGTAVWGVQSLTKRFSFENRLRRGFLRREPLAPHQGINLGLILPYLLNDLQTALRLFETQKARGFTKKGLHSVGQSSRIAGGIRITPVEARRHWLRRRALFTLFSISSCSLTPNTFSTIFPSRPT